MSSDKEIAQRNLDFQARARDYALVDIPQYRRWSEQKLAEGKSEALIGNLDARSIWLLPEEIQNLEEAVFEELLADLEASIGN